MKVLSFIFAILFLSQFHVFSQCNQNQQEITISITPDNYPQEISWTLFANGIQVGSGNSQGQTICVPNDACIQFTIFDSYGDGICCSYGNGSYSIASNGNVISTGGEFTTSETVSFGCPPGSSCLDAISIQEGLYTAPLPNYFYSLTPTTTAMYKISTCGLTNCDTKIWVYPSCTNYVTNNDNTGTLFYDDDNGGCAIQAVVNAYMEQNVTYIIKIGTKNNTACTDGIPFELTFEGEISGCTNPLACNYNPLATIENGTCIFSPNPDCPGGPDLVILEDVVRNTLQIRQEQATNCMVEEGCMNGYGLRTVLAFDTHIKNIGDMDYYVGNPNSNPSQFTFENCHGHAHYEGYAKYTLYRQDGTSIPIGHKNGFCVMDLECSDGGTAQYGCSNMGITKQCGDIYNRYLECQWIDITDVPVGEYIMAVQVNWDQSADALGRFELSYENNWAQACITITETSGVKGFQINQPCDPYLDCSGTPFGNTQMDCEGECGGTKVRGDLNANGSVETVDAQAYVEGILNQTLTTSNCNDLSADGILSVWDAALASNCALNSVVPNNCTFPNSITNYTQQIEMGYISINNVDQYIDVMIKNPNDRIVGYEINVSGVVISDVENLISVSDYPVTPQFSTTLGKIITLSYQDNTIPKNLNPTGMLRIYYSSLTSEDICISSVVHALNENHEPLTVNLVDACLSVLAIDEKGLPEFSIYPNPASKNVTISVSAKQNENLKVQLADALGRVLMEKILLGTETEVNLDVEHISSGLYHLNILSGEAKKSKAIVIQ
jgi:hypothetical protein